MAKKLEKFKEFVDFAPYGPVTDPEQQKAPYFYVMDQWPKSNYRMGMQYITAPMPMENNTMKHDEFDQFLMFLSTNTSDMSKPFDGSEIYCSLGEGDEMEQFVIDRTTAIYIPKGLPHGPMHFAKIKEPVLFVEITMSNNYSRHIKTEDGYTDALVPGEFEGLNAANAKGTDSLFELK